MKLTIFTPTYNRANLLNRVYNSLLRQKCRMFEWLIIDDGSTDNTCTVVNDFISEGLIDIRYIKKENGGKHTAHNLAVKEAKGELFICLDSDDMLSDTAVSIILQSVPTLQKNDCGFIGYKEDQNGKLLSSSFPMHLPEHLGLYSYQKNYSLRGEFTLVFRTNILKQYLFPVINEEKFIGECVLYDKLELNGFTLCPLLKSLEKCEYQTDGLSNNFYKLLCNNPAGFATFYFQRIQLSKSFTERIIYGIKYNAFYTLSKRKAHKCIKQLTLLILLTRIPGIIGSYYYLVKSNIKDKKGN